MIKRAAKCLRRQSLSSDASIQTVLDVGANTGQFATAAIHEILPEATIYSFEPLRECYDLLVKNMSYVSKFRAFNFALGSEDTHMGMHRSDCYQLPDLSG
jgi:FkbM family methyltransferase